MPGFPRRAPRQEFGPEPQNRYPVRNPNFEMDAETIGRLLLSTVAGSGLMVALAMVDVVTAAASGGSATVLERHESWNPYYKTAAPFTAPAVTRVSAGVFDIEYPANLPDYSGSLQPVEFAGGVAAYLDNTSTVLMARVIPNAPRSSKVRVRGWLLSGSSQTATDGTFRVWLF